MFILANMRLRDSRLVPVAGWIVSCLLALSALAWSAHVDWPQHNPQSHITASNMVDGGAASTGQTPDDNSYIDAGTGNHDGSCGHASSHLLALGSELPETPSVGPGNILPREHRNYQGLVHAPLIEPPIA